SPQSFPVQVFDFNGCVATNGPINGNVTILAPPFQATVVPQTATICIGEDVTFTGGNIDGVGPYYYWWHDANLDTISTQNNPFTYTPQNVGVEPLYMVGFDQCSTDTLQVDITVLGNPVPTFSATPNLGCSPLTSNLVNTTPGNFTLDL